MLPAFSALISLDCFPVFLDRPQLLEPYSAIWIPSSVQHRPHISLNTPHPRSLKWTGKRSWNPFCFCRKWNLMPTNWARSWALSDRWTQFEIKLPPDGQPLVQPTPTDPTSPWDNCEPPGNVNPPPLQYEVKFCGPSHPLNGLRTLTFTSPPDMKPLSMEIRRTLYLLQSPTVLPRVQN